ncbi:hypothetical protein NMG60_11029155 [Bertholletia excelsa]
MKRIRGFKLKHRVTRLFSFVLRRNGYIRIGSPTWESKPEPVSRLFTRVKTKLAKSICSLNPGRILVPGWGKGYDPLPDREKEKPAVPKGRTAVYVAVLVPVIYFNHPLFAALLREAEEEFGFNHPGGIKIPCQISEFESVRTRIAAGNRCRKLLTWKKTFLTY